MWNSSVHIAYVFALHLKQKHKKCSFAQYMKKFKWMQLWILKDIGQSAMRAQVATFAGWPMLSQFVRRQAPQKIFQPVWVPDFEFSSCHLKYFVKGVGWYISPSPVPQHPPKSTSKVYSIYLSNIDKRFKNWVPGLFLIISTYSLHGLFWLRSILLLNAYIGNMQLNVHERSLQTHWVKFRMDWKFSSKTWFNSWQQTLSLVVGIGTLAYKWIICNFDNS
jgi:hypothetical protein